MHDQLFLIKRIYHSYLAFIYAFTYRTNRRRILGFAASSWFKLLALALFLATWIQQWGSFLFTLTLLFLVWLRFAYWHSRRAGYARFIPESMNAVPTSALEPLPASQRIKIWATGTFTVGNREDYVLLCPAEYWRVPLGDHIVMAQVRPDGYLYQFFNAASLQKVQPGYLLFGKRLQNTMAITFLDSQHVVKPSQFNFATPEDINNSPGQKRTIYFTFENKENQQAVWHSIVNDAPRGRP